MLREKRRLSYFETQKKKIYDYRAGQVAAQQYGVPNDAQHH